MPDDPCNARLARFVSLSEDGDAFVLGGFQDLLIK
jgi:hypothetical protein